MPEVGHTPSKLLPFTATPLFLRCPLMTAIMQYDRRKALKIMLTSRIGGNCGSFIQYGILKVRKYIENTSLEMQPGRAELASITTAGREYRQRRDATAVWLHSKKKKRKKKKIADRPTLFFSAMLPETSLYFFLP